MSAPVAAAAAPPAPLIKKRGIVKQVLSGDSVIIRGPPKGGPPEEEQINFSNVIAPKLARRPAPGSVEDSKDEPYAWEAREFLRKQLIGETIWYTSEKPPNSKRSYGTIFLCSENNTPVNVTELIVGEGLVSVRREGVRITPDLQRLIDLEDAAKSSGKGRFGGSPSDHVRNIKWTQENPRFFVEHYQSKPVKAVIEHVRDGSTVRAFLLPDFQYITLMISGIRCPGFKLDAEGKPDSKVTVPFAEEARYFVESRLLQRDVEIILDSVNNTNFVGSILFPEGNIAEALLKRGFAKCVEWSMAFMKSGADKLHAAEKEAKEKRLRLWENYKPPAQSSFTGKEKEIHGTVVEIFNADAINVKSATGQSKKIFFSSIRPPREVGRTADEDGKLPPRPKNSRPLYDIPWMFEAREYLRKKLIGKKVVCLLDYISPARDTFPEKYCYTVLIDKTNVAEALVGQGFATVVRYRQDDDQRSSRYEDLLAAESVAVKGMKGVHAKKDIPSHRINDLTVDHSRVKIQYLPSWQRALRTEGVVEFVASGSRFRLYIPKDSCIVTFLLGGISCPRSSRPALNGVPAVEGEPFGDEALSFSKERIMHRDVSVHIETTDKAGASVIGWLWTDNNVNLSVALVEEGLASVHFSAEKSEHYRALKTAEDSAKTKRKNIWANYVEEVEVEKEPEIDEKDEKVVERKVNAEKVIITDVSTDLKFFAQHADNGVKLETLMSKLRADFQANSPVAGAYTPKRGDLCAARFTEDNEWYRAKIEKVQGNNVSVVYVDYGNKETLPSSRLAHLPPAISSDRPYATEYALALTVLPPDEEDKIEACKAFAQDVLNKTLNLNVEYKINNLAYATLSDPATNLDIAKGLITDGLILAEKRRERKVAKLVEEYKQAEQTAKRTRSGIWQYGDITEDEPKEFGAGR
jgi:staphylococcal nuclease domain-containing protein 1